MVTSHRSLVLGLFAVACTVAPPGPFDEDEQEDAAAGAITATSCPAGTSATICSGAGQVFTAQYRAARNATASLEVAQTFTLTQHGTPESVRLKLRRTRNLASGADPLVTVSLRAVAGGVVPTDAGSDLASAAVAASAIERGLPTEHVFTFSPAPALFAPGTYAVVVRTAQPSSGDVVVGVASHVTASYAGGQAYVRRGTGAFLAHGTGSDLSFSVQLSSPCPAGEDWNGSACVDHDECTDVPAVCGPNATCTNTAPGHTCACEVGFESANGACVATGGEYFGQSSTHSCVVRADGSLWCWGSNAIGALGVGDTVGRTSPTRVGTANDWSRVAVGEQDTCALRDDDTLWCWGYNGQSQLGIGNTTAQYTPVQVPGSWKRITIGWNFTCGVKSEGTLWCWGYGQEGRLGLGETSNHATPAQVGSATDWTTVSAGNSHACAMKGAGELWCWGRSPYGQTGNGAGTFLTPQRVGTFSDWTEISAGTSHSCGRRGGLLYCWGSNLAGELGQGGSIPGSPSTTPVQVGTGADWATVNAGSNVNAVCARKTDGSLWCWGNNGIGNVGDGTVTSRSSPVRVGTGTDWRSIRIGTLSCATRSDLSLSCWGSDTNASGFFGGGPVESTTPVPVDGPTFDTAPVGGQGYRLALKAGALYGWGQNHRGQLALGDVVKRATPALLSGFSWSAITANSAHACGLTGGALWCWGQNGSGELGQGFTSTQQPTPLQVGLNTDWISASTAGQSVTCGVRAPGTLWCWGRNNQGQLGLAGDTTQRTTPAQVGSASDWAVVRSGSASSCGRRTDGSLWCWGYNGFQGFGDGVTTMSTAPVQVAGTWGAFTVGGSHFCALTPAGALWCWGGNYTGQLGLGTGDTTDRLSPARVGVESDWTHVAASVATTCGRRSNGTLWCWGANDYGRLGLGDTTPRGVPVQVGTATDWASVDQQHGDSSFCARKSSGAVHCWGRNDLGQLGNGLAFSYVPRAVPLP